MDSDLLQGRIDGDKLRQLADHLLDFSRFDEAFICGPAAMMDEAEATLRELGVAEKSIHLERFNTPRRQCEAGRWSAGGRAHGDHPPRTGAIGLSPSAPKTTASWMPHCVRAPICRSPVRAGYAPPVNAKCCAVKWRWPPITASEADELAAGYVLSCQSLPTSGDVVVDFDARGWHERPADPPSWPGASVDAEPPAGPQRAEQCLINPDCRGAGGGGS